MGAGTPDLNPERAQMKYEISPDPQFADTTNIRRRLSANHGGKPRFPSKIHLQGTIPVD